jgi:PHD/YefM family antitoxin component YafN of YafNO toxin-antitoxin module
MIYFIKNYFGGKLMPAIRKSADLRNNYSEISEFCHNYREPIFITKNGQGDLAVMGIETYEEMNGRLELYQKILLGLSQIKNGETVPEEKIMKKIKQYAGI